MSTIKRTDDDNHPIIKEVYEDIKQSRNTTYIGNFWKYLAFDPQLLKNVCPNPDANAIKKPNINKFEFLFIKLIKTRGIL